MRKLILIFCMLLFMASNALAQTRAVFSVTSTCLLHSDDSIGDYTLARDVTEGTTDTGNANIYNTHTGATYYIVRRLFLMSDTSAIPNAATIDSAKVVFYCSSLDVDPSDYALRLIQSTQAGSAANGWINDFTGWASSGVYSVTDVADSMLTSSFAATDTIRFSLNSTGLAAISKTDSTIFALLHGDDVNNVSPPASTNATFTDDGMYIEVWYAEGSSAETNVVDIDAWLGGSDAVYATARDKDTADSYGEAYLTVGQREGVANDVYRIFQEYDIPSMLSATSCTLYVNGRSDSSEDDFELYVLSAHDSSPAFTVADFGLFDGHAAAGAHTGTVLNNIFNSSSLSGEWNAIIFNDAGLDSLVSASVEGKFWLVLISKEDYDNSAPSESTDEYVIFEDSSFGDDKEPYLSYSYTAGGYTGNAMGADNPKNVMGVPKANLKNFLGVE